MSKLDRQLDDVFGEGRVEIYWPSDEEVDVELLRLQLISEIDAHAQRIPLDLGTGDAKTFEERRVAYHRAQQDRFFRRHVISDVIEHTIRRGESRWIVALRQYDVPMWLFRQYNPGLDMHNVRPGVRVQIPVLADASTG